MTGIKKTPATQREEGRKDVRKYQLGFTFAAAEDEARRMVEQFNSEATPYMRKHHPAHFTPWESSSQTDPAHFVVWHYV